MDTCHICGNEITGKQYNRTTCMSCLGKMGGRKKKSLAPKIPKINNAGYLYYVHTMLTPYERTLVPTDGRIILVHRLVMAKELGRPLIKGEIVMHLNGDRQDNRPENLMVGDPLTNTRQHWQAQRDAERWKQIAITLLSLISVSN